MDFLDIYRRFYEPESPLWALLGLHSELVRRRAEQVLDRHPELGADRALVVMGSLLHDIGICRCDAPSIGCHGTEPYLRHGPIGAQMLRALPEETFAPLSREALARICERHTGTGLPGYEPETLEEEIVCYADKFFSKSHPERERNVEQTAEMLSRFGDASVEKFLGWAARFE